MKYSYITLLWAASVAFGASAATDIGSIKSAAVPPAAHTVLIDGFHNDIHPQGWLREILERQNSGLTSHPEAMSYPFDSNLWVGELERDSENRGADWWRYEQTAYYLDGLTRLGFLLDDEALIATAAANVDWIHSRSNFRWKQKYAKLRGAECM